MTPAGWILRAVKPDRGGPTHRSVLEHLAEHHGAECGKTLINDLIAAGKLALYGKKRASRWGLPKLKKGAPRK